MSMLEWVAVAVSLLGIWLTARRLMVCWPVNILACALYFKLFLDVKLYADMVLQALFGLAMVYGWWAWWRSRRQGMPVAGDVVVAALPRGSLVLGLGAGTVGAMAIGWFTSHYTDAALPWMDAALSSFSLVAQVWAARRHAENWLLWIVVDVIYVGMFVFKGLWLTAGLYAALVVLAVLGWRQWRGRGIAVSPG
ncbi:nicotinamide riboside transporter PnuC [Novosphingobium pokkalii]|uniref:Nicotinamide riboside transporter PnuC n=1 Tax=Novosphingobium pokkalii TaxID=1770194 RepID=A0ABV7UXX8_9SPHN|nr:nicotinamide riboside transporter PnuC [Novosphingobium pokkalii]GHC94606.1 aminotransferase [Novosphingobium pokkalii]